MLLYILFSKKLLIINLYSKFLLFFFCLIGAINSRYYLESDEYVPERILKKIDKTTSSMIESGFHKFFSSFWAFTEKIASIKLRNPENYIFQALTIKQLIRIVILLLYLLSISSIFFAFEVIIHKWNRSRNPNSRRHSF